MAEAFNPYREWLGIDVAERPSHYNLLSLPPYEEDPDVISLAAERSSTKVRSFRPGPNAAAWSRLLDEIRAARECLLSVNEKIDYDRKLRAGVAGGPVAAAAATQASRPAGKAEADFYPPGMGPPPARNNGRGLGQATRPDAAAPAPAQPAVSPAPDVAAEGGIDALSMLPPGLSVDAAPAAAGHAGGSYYHQTHENAPLAPTAPLGAMPAQPVAAAPMAMPMGGVPMAMPAGIPMAAMPAGMPMSAMPTAYGGAPMASPMAQPYGGQPYGAQAYSAQPYGAPAYGAPAYSAPAPGFPAAMPLGAAGAAAPLAQPMGGYGSEPSAYGGDYAAGYPGMAGAYAAPAAHDPMAPLAMPGVAGAAPYGAPLAAAVPATGAIPMGSAVPSAQTPAGDLAAGLPRRSNSAAVLAAKQERASQRTFLLAGIGGTLMLMAAAVVYVVMANSQESEEVAQNAPVEATNPTGEPAAEPIARSTESTLPTQPKTVLPLPGSKTPAQPAPMPTPQPAPMPAPSTQTPLPMPEPPAPAPESPTPEPTPPAPSPTPAPTPTPPPPPTPAPTPEPQATITPAEATKLGKAMADAKVALREQNFAEADKQLAIAEPLAKIPDHATKLARLQEVAEYVKQFRQAVADSVAEMDAGSTFKVGTSAMVAVVETFPNKIIVRAAGQNREYLFQDLPPGLAVAIADLKLDTSAPENKVIKAAYLAVTKPDEEEVVSKAKTWLEEASLGGVDVTSMQTFLTDKYDDLAKDIPKAE